MADLKLGILLFNQATTWPELRTAARRIDQLGYDHLWAWDHIYAIFGDPYQPIFDGWSMLTGYAVATEHARLGLLVGANTFRNPGLSAKNAVTLDHISNGRAILGLGAAWFDLEHEAHGLEFGHSVGERLDWLDESAAACRALLDGGEVTSAPSAHYAFDHLRHQPLPVQKHLPIMIGGGGEKKTLRTVAKYADMWNGMGSAETLKRKGGILREHCEAVGRDEKQIERTLGCKIVIRDNEADAEAVWAAQMAHNKTPRERWDSPDTLWLGPPQKIADEILARREHGFETALVELPAPFDVETIERLIGEVKPLVDAG
jgi:alkanesulfonate monooxygenase SsuD/methylene tetrahydromethanopterin reductase-like flavin-dependent oxidoreductase (luciferase family)